jgi:hypothetical protein
MLQVRETVGLRLFAQNTMSRMMPKNVNDMNLNVEQSHKCGVYCTELIAMKCASYPNVALPCLLNALYAPQKPSAML